MVLPPGPTTCPLDCTRSCAEERRVPKSVPLPERCAACFNALLTLSLTSPYLLYVWGSQYCRAINQNWMHPARSRVDGHDRTLFSFSLQRKRHRGLKKDLCLLPVSRQLRCLPFFLPPFVLFFLLFVCILRWPQPYWEGICQINLKKKKAFSFLHPNKHKDFNMYRSHRWTMADLRGHNRVALWSSCVKVYALSHMGKEPCDLILLSSMIMLLLVDVSHWFHRLSCTQEHRSKSGVLMCTDQNRFHLLYIIFHKNRLQSFFLGSHYGYTVL